MFITWGEQSQSYLIINPHLRQMVNFDFWDLRFKKYILSINIYTLRNICSDKTLIEKIKYKTPVDVRAISFQLITHSKSHCVLSG